MNAITMVLEGKTVEIQQLDEKLTPNQKTIDGNKNGKMDAEDFKMLRAEEKCSSCGKMGKNCSCGVKEETKIDEEVEELNEALRKISEHGKGTGAYHAEVRYDPEYQEYQSHFYKDGEHMGEGPVGYHGSGKEGKKDAQDTAEHQVKRMNSKAMSEGAYTQHYMDANKASPVRQAAEIAKAPKQKVSFKKDPINATTNAMYDKALDVFQNFGKKKVAEEVSETTFKHNDFEIELAENLSYADYLKAVKTIVNSDDPSIQSEIISIAAEAYDTQDMNVMIEAKTMAYANDIVESLRKADINTTVSDPESIVLEGKPGFKYSKTNNGKTSITIHTASGVVRKV